MTRLSFSKEQFDIDFILAKILRLFLSLNGLQPVNLLLITNLRPELSLYRAVFNWLQLVTNKSTPIELYFHTKHVLSVFIRVDETSPPAGAVLCHYFCGSCLCKYTVCLTQKPLVKFDPYKKNSNQASCVQIPEVCVHVERGAGDGSL